MCNNLQINTNCRKWAKKSFHFRDYQLRSAVIITMKVNVSVATLWKYFEWRCILLVEIHAYG